MTPWRRADPSRTRARHLVEVLAVCVVGVLTIAATARAQERVSLMGASCTGSPDALVIQAETGRAYYLDYPCDLRAREDVKASSGPRSTGS